MLNFIQSRKAELHKCKAYDEATTKQAIILPLLQKLGWDIFNCEEVCPEYGIAGKRVDYALRAESKNLYFLEIKKCSVDLGSHQEQLLQYAFREGVTLACLTNGITWQFFIPLREGNWENRLFYTIDIENQAVEDVVSIFSKVLGKAAVKSKETTRWANELYQRKTRSDALVTGLPEAWEMLLRDPSSAFVDAVADKVEKVCGHRPDKEHITEFFAQMRNDAIYPNKKNIPLPCLPATALSPQALQASHVTICGVCIPTERHLGKSHEYFTKVLPLLLPLLPPEEIVKLQTVEYCHSSIQLNTKQIPLLSKKEEDTIDRCGHRRAWAKPIAGFYVFSQWTVTNLPKWKLYLKRLERELNPPINP